MIDCGCFSVIGIWPIPTLLNEVDNRCQQEYRTKYAMLIISPATYSIRIVWNIDILIWARCFRKFRWLRRGSVVRLEDAKDDIMLGATSIKSDSEVYAFKITSYLLIPVYDSRLTVRGWRRWRPMLLRRDVWHAAIILWTAWWCCLVGAGHPCYLSCLRAHTTSSASVNSQVWFHNLRWYSPENPDCKPTRCPEIFRGRTEIISWHYPKTMALTQFSSKEGT